MERLHMNEIREIIYQLRQGEGIREIARSLNFSRNTVRKYRDVAEEHGLLDIDKPLPDLRSLGVLFTPPPRPRHMRSTVEPFGEVVAELLEAGVEMMSIWQRLRDEHGYKGSYTSVRRYVTRIRPGMPEAVCRVETAPGEEAQVDFGYAGLQWDPREGRRRKAWFFVMTLSWSRHQYLEAVFDQKIETWLRCHERAFRWFGGTPGRIVLDNLKAGVIKPDLHDPVLGEPYRRLAHHYGFMISPNRPHTPRHKGKVESGVRYVKRNFLAGREFADITALNERAKQWVIETAGTREHGTTRQAPLERFTRTERKALRPLPQTAFDLTLAFRAKVHHDCHVVVDGRCYSAPYRLIGRRVDVYVGQRVVEIYHGADLVTTHPVVEKRGGRSTRLEHYPEAKRAYMQNPPETCRERASRIGPACERVVDGLLADRVYDRLRSVQSLLRFADEVGKLRLERACQRALHYGDPTYRRVKAIVRAGLESEPLEGVISRESTSASYRYARPAASFFARGASS